MAKEAAERTLQQTPTWVVASICFGLIFASIIIEQLLHLVAKYYLNKKRRKSLFQTLHSIKSDLMLLGFTSLLLVVTENYIAKICIHKSAGLSFLPCGSPDASDETEEEAKCAEQGKMSLISRSGVQQLQYLIFVLASSHSWSCILIFGLGMAKMIRWESWEAETRTTEYQYSRDPNRFQLSHQTSFGKRHLKYWSEHKILCWPTFFIRQFYGSVTKVDYLTLRHGFIVAHFSQQSSFDFQKYIGRALEKDYTLVVGTRLWIWIFSMFFIFFNAHKFHSYLWLPFIPLAMLLLVGTKLQGIITSMCLESHEKSHVVRGTLLVSPSDHYFWFGQPKLLLHLIHFILFQNSFQLAFFIWTWFKFGLQSCFHDETEDIIIRIVMGLLVHFLCGYVTLPLYALVTQMGTSMRDTVFTENVTLGLERWKYRARKKLKRPYSARSSPPQDKLSLEASPAVDSSSSSLDSSPTNEAPTEVELDPPSDSQHFAIEVVEHDTVKEQPQRRQKRVSFPGFDVSNNATPTSDEYIH